MTLLTNSPSACKLFLLAALPILFLQSCKKDKPEPVDESTTLSIMFRHTAGNDNLQFGKPIYVNAAGNPYEVTEIMYFISDLSLYKAGVEVNPNEWDDIHYVDSKLPQTMEWTVGTNVPEGLYDSIKFTFGISEAKNKSFLFVNPPEVSMAWPEVLGGGYHYMMLNGFWNDTAGMRTPFDFHLGIGQLYENNSGKVEDITGFVHNDFPVVLSNMPIQISKGATTAIGITMDVNSWFETPIVFDFNEWGGAIMQKQDAMHIGCLNGRDAFSYDILLFPTDK